MAYEKEKKEIMEAMAAGDDAIYYLEGAMEKLNSAGNWGIADILGGGMIISAVKRSRMREAQREMEKAKQAMMRFSREVADVDRSMNTDLDLDGFMGFADFFFDSFFIDMMVQSKINDAKRQIQAALEQVEEVCDILDAMLRRYEKAQ
ncbi:MAG: hypothetical protein IJI75_08060 [Solobacterium sp.]|nr:hypothetical protein [Bacillota bacterium]MBQ6489170.1 hypothetical protein [Solobacterium sp.]